MKPKNAEGKQLPPVEDHTKPDHTGKTPNFQGGDLKHGDAVVPVKPTRHAPGTGTPGWKRPNN